MVPVNLLVAPVGFRNRIDQHDHIIANVLDFFRFVGYQSVGQLHQHLGRPHLGGVHSAVEVVNTFAFLDQFCCALLIGFTRIRKLGKQRFVVVSIRESGLVGYDH